MTPEKEAQAKEVLHDIANCLTNGKGQQNIAIRALSKSPVDPARIQEHLQKSNDSIKKMEHLVLQLRTILFNKID